MKDLILSEVNVKELELVDAGSGILVKRVKPDFKKLGPKFGKTMKQVAASIQQMSQADILHLESQGCVTLHVGDADAVIELADVEVISEDIPGWLVANEGNVTVALDITVTPELRAEGIARDIVNRIQNIRKNRNYDITDKITLTFAPASAEAEDALNRYADYISRQVLATALVTAPVDPADPEAETLELDDMILTVKIALS